VLRYNPVIGEYLFLRPTLSDRRGGASFVLGGYLYAAGGGDDSWSVERYDASTSTWTEVADMLEGRSYACAVIIGSTSPPEDQGLFDSLIAKASRRQA
jgi:hypothetical protein